MSDWEKEVIACARPLDDLDWRDSQAVRSLSNDFLSSVAGDKALLGRMIRSLATDSVRFGRCERDNQIQLVLFDHLSSGCRLRLHIMPEGMPDYPHGHRYAFGSLVLRGVMEQVIYAALDWGEEPIKSEPPALLDFLVRPGESYALNHPTVHKVNVLSGPVVTLFLRSPALKHQATNFDSSTGEHRWQRGANTGASEGRHRPLQASELSDVIATLQELAVIPARIPLPA